MKKLLIPLTFAILGLGRPAFADYEAYRGKLQDQVRQACANDIGLNCNKLDFDSGLYTCLEKNHEILNDDCKAKLKKYDKFLKKHEHRRKQKEG